jgi:hypothetical protein
MIYVDFISINSVTVFRIPVPRAVEKNIPLKHGT